MRRWLLKYGRRAKNGEMIVGCRKNAIEKKWQIYCGRRLKMPLIATG
jgi:hypothetical protein